MLLGCFRSDRLLLGLVIALSVAASALAQSGKTTVDLVRERGVLRCAVHTGFAGMSAPDSNGQWKGLFVDYCRALAAVILEDPDKVRFIPVSSQQRFTVLQTGEVDVLSRTTSWTLSRDSSLGLNFTGVLFFDGQGFLVPASLGVQSVNDLDGATICIKSGTTAELNTAEYFAAAGLKFRPVVFQGSEEAKLAFFSGRCDALTTDASVLTSVRIADAERPEDYVVLPERLSKEPLSPTVRSDDDQWFDINKWLLTVLIAAEEHGITQSNVATLKDTSANAEVQRILGVKPGMGRALGLDDNWGYRAIEAVGNYEELYERHIAPLGIERGQNHLYTEGGLMYPLPIR
ncbi:MULTISPECIES: amino acid ABC transporter substrate-binding protein [unclassified Hyphomonas]|jgi:general L-amino acid transport system substrate-binding protein|uniref:amino acid ABC transporter substrate-binding protein n=1 Tax=unclassified Hyphomonas TaxID=2630699 RepID=UPI000C48A6D8|nr:MULTISPECIES: amino acid ABC transporter substrate-binding protein [unclassified Hyphomonas]MAL43721.1 amino acid ABC transporter substrate-binding protein [Hyphomonas sp.]MAX84550.1 amino acid ABC transporter substrate-binding protein [Hyphomonas sp.]HAW55316.1 amino acid ABC transporter substrate-binding protein [Hyphomonas sp.]HBN94036.1 amino acid ABC transporter substrate-binding protein [Hyphomonas sp.]HBU32881.1 amino acid ABC transporter substrate-binding protein [Hyphomonas sp.]|tara:strand:+ start:12384 stop:13421 length:1038 start_codon:yes stop_codon:yes gene_type:complete